MAIQPRDCRSLGFAFLLLSGCGASDEEPMGMTPEREVASEVKVVPVRAQRDNEVVKSNGGSESSSPADSLNKNKAFEATAKEFWQEFKGDAKKAREKYEGATVTLSGYATDMGVMDDSRGRYHGRISLSGEPIGLGVYALTKDPWDKIRVPSSATIRGIGRVDSGNFFLDHAEVINEDAVPTIRIDATAIAQEMLTAPDETKMKYNGEFLIVTGTVNSTTATVHHNYDAHLMLKGTETVPIALAYFVLDKKQFSETKVGDELTVFGNATLNSQNDEPLIHLSACVNLGYLKTVGIFSGKE